MKNSPGKIINKIIFLILLLLVAGIAFIALRDITPEKKPVVKIIEKNADSQKEPESEGEGQKF